jgi:hypothetical protein
MTEEIKSQILLRVKTVKGLVTHGMQFDMGSYQSNIICVFCLNRNKLTTSKTLKQHARHVLNEHSEIL